VNGISDFIDSIVQFKCKNAFNPYTDVCEAFDAHNSPAIRRQNLRAVMDAAMSNGVHSLWVARDLGHRGGRRTGLPLTDDVHIESHAGLCGAVGLRRATTGPPMVEVTARTVWNVLADVKERVFLWNVFPLHPHETGLQLSNRPHTRDEALASRSFLEWLVRNLRPTVIVSIGNDAQNALSRLDLKSTKVRHPSHGGQREFASQIRRLYRGI
jgi:hypothetical protein